MVPKEPKTASRVIHPPTVRYAVSAERKDGTRIDADRSWVSAPGDYQAKTFFEAAVKLARSLDLDPRYFLVPETN
jgi:hypothetical protein